MITAKLVGVRKYFKLEMSRFRVQPGPLEVVFSEVESAVLNR